MTSLGCEIETLWQNLLAGKSGVDRVTFFDPTNYDCQIGAEIRDFEPAKYMPVKETRRTDRFTQLAVAAAKMALEDGKLDLAKEDLNRIGVLVGSGIGGLQTIQEQHSVLMKKGPSRVSPFMIPMLIVNMASGYVSMLFGIKGPNLSVVSACATAAHALGESCRWIIHGDAEVVLAGGSEAAVTELGYAGFSAMRAMSTRNEAPQKASRPFDKERDGFVMGEGAGVLVLEALEHARKRGARIYCEIIGYATTADAYHMTSPPDDGEGAARCMQNALKSARVNPADVSYINAHGTSTPQGDVAESTAVKTVFGDSAKKVPVSSTKSMTGHLLGAAGSVEMAICAKALQTDQIPPTINYEFPDPACDLDYVPNQARQAKVNIALNNSFGFGGHNVSIVAKKFV
jgi:3-oxoacyl-[acyl-carrier-protein] synthase II